MPLRGTTQELEVTFFDAPGGTVADPVDGSVTLQVFYNGDSVLSADPDDIAHDGTGHFTYDWAIPADSEPGVYVVTWGSVLPGESVPSYGYQNVTVTATLTGLPGFSGCVWPIDPGCLSTTWSGYDETTQQRAVSLASATLTRLTAGRVGDCPVRVRPDLQRGFCGFSGPLPWYGGTPWGAPPYAPSFAWPGKDARELELPAPIYSVAEVKVDGVVIDPTDYVVHNRNTLVYVGTALDGWPLTQDMDLASTEDNTFEVTYLNTAPVDAQGAHAAGLMAMEFAKACSGDKGCKFPSNVSTLTRAGVSIEFITGAFPDGLTGVREVDAYTAQWNRKGRSPATLIDPGAPNHRIVTG